LWPGTAKLAEECGEVIQIIAKLVATAGRTDHWSGLDLETELEDEIADVQAACAFVIEKNHLDRARIERRTDQKQMLFGRWHGDDFHSQEMSTFLRSSG
jgi:NTP pyrophosphatase (non-canonical NTP hydrolase)